MQKDGSLITTKRTGSSDCTSNEISVQLLDGGSRVSIQQSQVQCRAGQVQHRAGQLHIGLARYSIGLVRYSIGLARYM